MINSPESPRNERASIGKKEAPSCGPCAPMFTCISASPALPSTSSDSSAMAHAGSKNASASPRRLRPCPISSTPSATGPSHCPQRELAWLEASRGRTLRQVEQLVAGHKPGDQPGDPADPSLRRHVLRMEVTAETFATFREAMAKLRRESNAPLDEDTALLLMARHVLAGPTDEGRSSYQVAVTICSECNRGWQQGRGEQLEVDPA